MANARSTHRRRNIAGRLSAPNPRPTAPSKAACRARTRRGPDRSPDPGPIVFCRQAGRASSSRKSAPAKASRCAAYRPPKPPPTMTIALVGEVLKANPFPHYGIPAARCGPAIQAGSGNRARRLVWRRQKNFREGSEPCCSKARQRSSPAAPAALASPPRGCSSRTALASPSPAPIPPSWTTPVRCWATRPWRSAPMCNPSPISPACADETKAAFGHLDIFFANAGAAAASPLGSTEEAVYTRLMDINLIGVFFWSRRWCR